MKLRLGQKLLWWFRLEHDVLIGGLVLGYGLRVKKRVLGKLALQRSWLILAYGALRLLVIEGL